MNGPVLVKCEGIPLLIKVLFSDAENIPERREPSAISRNLKAKQLKSLKKKTLVGRVSRQQVDAVRINGCYSIMTAMPTQCAAFILYQILFKWAVLHAPLYFCF